MDVSFYGILNSDLNKVVIKLLEKSYAIHKKSLLITIDDEVSIIDNTMWTSSYWLPHAKCIEDKINLAPIGIGTEKTCNSEFLAKIKYDYLFYLNNSKLENDDDFNRFEKNFVIFDMKNDSILSYNASRLQKFKQNNCNVMFYKQDINGKFIQDKNV